MSSITLSSPRIKGNLLLVDMNVRGVSRYIKSGTFRYRYPGMDLANIHPSILIIPALGAIISVAYAAGVKVKVDSVDADFANCIDELAGVWKSIYPNFNIRKFSLVGKKIDNNNDYKGEGDICLYSGGVDAFSTLLKNKEKIRGLISIWGADISLSRADLWQHLQSVMEKTLPLDGLDKYIIKTNLRKFFYKSNLYNDFLKGESGTWWMKAQHGLALLTASAPISVQGKYSRILIASSHSNEFKVPWGSSPITDNKLRWSGVEVYHDNFDLTRQEKIENIIAPHLQSGGSAQLAVCYKSRRGKEGSINCGSCEKCFRTATGLMVAGVDPRSVGLPLNMDAMKQWVEKIRTGKRKLTDNEVFMWGSIKKSIMSKIFMNFEETTSDYILEVMSTRFHCE